MKFGVVYPQIELRGDPQAVHDIGVGVEELGYDYLLVYDHVVGAEHADREPPLWGPYTERDPFHEPLVMFGYLAAVTSRIELATGVMILPQRQTALVAQQAADADLLSRAAGPPRRRDRVELRRVRRAGSGLRHPGRPPRRADRPPAAAVGGAAGHVRGPVRSRRAGLHQPPAATGRSRSGSAGSASRPTGAPAGWATGSPSPATSTPPWRAWPGFAITCPRPAGRPTASASSSSPPGPGARPRWSRPPNAGGRPAGPTCRSSRSSSAWTRRLPTSTTPSVKDALDTVLGASS